MIGQNNYKRDNAIQNMLKEDRKGQVALFVIIAIVIVSIIVIFVFYDDLEPIIPDITGGGGGFSPQAYLAGCISPEIEPYIEHLGKNAGYDNISDSGTVMHQGEEYKYLCYIGGYYQRCIVQQPFVKNNFELALVEKIEPRINSCIDQLKQEYESRGYSVNAGRARANVEIVPSAIQINYDAPMTVTKDGSTKTFTGFDVKVGSEMYEVLYIAQSIIDFESALGDSEITLYIQYYPNLLMYKTKLSDGTTVYRVGNALTGEEFRFASRSLAWPAGYGVTEIYGL